MNLVQAKIDHSKALKDYQQAWNGGETLAIALTWGEVKRTHDVFMTLLKAETQKKSYRTLC